MSEVWCVLNMVVDVRSCDQHMQQILGAHAYVFCKARKIPYSVVYMGQFGGKT